MDFLLPALWALTPTVVVGLIFWFVFRAILRSDRTEREAVERYEREDDAREAEGARHREG